MSECCYGSITPSDFEYEISDGEWDEEIVDEWIEEEYVPCDEELASLKMRGFLLWHYLTHMFLKKKN